LNEDAGSVARVLLGTARTAVVEIFKKLKRVIDQRVRARSGQVHEHTDTAVGSLAKRDIQPTGQPGLLHTFRFITIIQNGILRTPWHSADLPVQRAIDSGWWESSPLGDPLNAKDR